MTLTADVYLCPTHPDVRQSNPGKCPRCGVKLIAEATRFSSLFHLAIVAGALIAIMAAVMMMR
jgi:uncharacterized paraquat-inducible protein A